MYNMYAMKVLAQNFIVMMDWPYDVIHMVESSISLPNQFDSADQESP